MLVSSSFFYTHFNFFLLNMYPPKHIKRLLSRKIHVAIFTCVRWCKICMALITKFVCQLVCGYDSNCNTRSMLHIVQFFSTMPKAGWHDESIFSILHRQSIYTLRADQKTKFLWPTDIQHSSHGLLTASSFLEWGPCKHETVKDNGKLCFERAIVKKMAFALPLNSHWPNQLTFLSSQLIDINAGWTE